MSAGLHKTLNPQGCFRKRRLTNTPRRHRVADGQLSSSYAPLPCFSLFGAASCDVLFRSSCLLERTVCATIGLVVNIISIRRFCDQINVLHIFDPTCIVLKTGSSFKMGPPDHYFLSFVSVSPHDATAKPMASSHHVSPLTRCQLVWRRLCEALRSSSLAGLKCPPLLPRLV